MALVVEPRSYLDPDVLRMVDEVQQEYVDRYGGPDSAALDADEFEPPRGLLLVGLLDDVPVAMGGWRRLGAHEAEIRRMYVRGSARRRGVARELLAEVERTAAGAGITRLVLAIGLRQPEAIALYVSAGYAPCAGFGFYADSVGARFYAKELPGSAHATARDREGERGPGTAGAVSRG